MLFDSHAHLYMLEHDDLDKILERAKDVGVERMITVSTELSNWETNQTHAQKYPGVYFSLGVHPHEAKYWPEWESKLENWFPSNKIPDRCLAIGELGLDYHYNHSTPEQQKQALEAQLQLAKQLNLPAIVHCRNAFKDFFEVADAVGSNSGVMHCFTGTYEEAKASLDRGFVISFSGILTFKKSQDLRDTAKKLPLDKLLIETDCPFLAPMPHRGKPNEPSYLPLTAQTLALEMKKGVEEVIAATTHNTNSLFGL